MTFWKKPCSFESFLGRRGKNKISSILALGACVDVVEQGKTFVKKKIAVKQKREKNNCGKKFIILVLSNHLKYIFNASPNPTRGWLPKWFFSSLPPLLAMPGNTFCEFCKVRVTLRWRTVANLIGPPVHWRRLMWKFDVGGTEKIKIIIIINYSCIRTRNNG